MKSYQPNDEIRLTSGFRAVVIGDYGDEVEVRVLIGGWGKMLAKVGRDEIVSECAECDCVLDDDFRLRDDGKPLCPDCYERLYGARDREDAWHADGDRRFDMTREDGLR